MRLVGNSIVPEDDDRIIIHYQDILHFEIEVLHLLDDDELSGEDKRRHAWLTAAAENDWNNFTQETVDLDMAVSIENYCSSLAYKIRSLLRMGERVIVKERVVPLFYEYGNPLCNSSNPDPHTRRY